MLGFAKVGDATKHLDADERRVVAGKSMGIISPLAVRDEVTVVNESGLYSLILRSRKPEAKAFKK